MWKKYYQKKSTIKYFDYTMIHDGKHTLTKSDKESWFSAIYDAFYINYYIVIDCNILSFITMSKKIIKNITIWTTNNDFGQQMYLQL